MKRSKGGGDEEAPRQNGSASRRKADQQQSDGDEGGSDIGPADLQDDDNDQGLRREIRSKYRDLISSVQREWQVWGLPKLLICMYSKQILDVCSSCFVFQRTGKIC